MMNREGNTEAARRARAEELRQKELADHIKAVTDYMAQGMSAERAIIERFRDVRLNEYPPKTQEAWKQKILAEIEHPVNP